MTSIRLTLQAIESQIDSGKIGSEHLNDIKSTVDDVRLRIWAILASQHFSDGTAALKRFRVRRAVELLESVNADLTSPDNGIREKDLDLMAGAARRLLDSIELSRSKER